MKPLDMKELNAASEFTSVSARLPRKIDPRALKATLLLVASLTIMSGATISPSLPEMERQFADTPNAALMTRFALTLPALLVAIFAPLAGGLADRYGRKRLLACSILLFAFAGMSGLFLDTLGGILTGRAFLGVAVAGVMTATTALVGDYFAGEERDRYMGLQMAFTGFGGLVFLSGGGFLADFHWRAPFAVYALAFVILPAAMLFLYEPSVAKQQNGSTDKKRDRGLFTLPIVALFIVGFINSAAFYLIPTQLPFFLRTLGIETPSSVGMAMGLFTLCQAVMALGYGRLRGKGLTIPALFGIGFAFMAIGLFMIGGAASYSAVLVAIGITGVGMGMVMPNLMAGALSNATPAMRGRVAGGMTASIFLGQFISPLASQPIIAVYDYATAYRVAGATLALVAALAVVILMREQSGIRPKRSLNG